MSAPLVELVVEEAAWLGALPDLERLAQTAAALACDGAGLRRDGHSLCVMACDDARIAALNEAFRGQAAPTNVLSWPAFDLAAPRPGAPPRLPPDRGGTDAPTHLGDLAIALQTAEREAKDASIPLKDHVVHLILHGSLHLLGFDHKIDEDAAIMEGLETRLLARIGIPDPYSRGDAALPQSN